MISTLRRRRTDGARVRRRRALGGTGAIRYNYSKRSGPLQSSTLSSTEQRGARIEGCGFVTTRHVRRTPFDYAQDRLRYGLHYALRHALRQAQDVAQDAVSAYPGCFMVTP